MSGSDDSREGDLPAWSVQELPTLSHPQTADLDGTDSAGRFESDRDFHAMIADFDVRKRAVGSRGRSVRAIVARLDPEVVRCELLSKPIVLLSLATLLVFITVTSILGPLETDSQLEPLQRLLYWGLFGGTLWPFCYCTGAIALELLRFYRPLEAGLAVVTVLCALYGGLLGTSVLYVADTLFRPDESTPSFWAACAVSTVIVGVCDAFICLVVHQRIRHRFVQGRDDAAIGEQGVGENGETPVPSVVSAIGAGSVSVLGVSGSPAHDEAQVRFLDRLPVGLGNDLIYLKVDDHYIDIYTTGGHGVLLMCMADAVAELGIMGLQVHRSFWAASTHMQELVTLGGRKRLHLTGGHQVPVSRTYLPAVRGVLRAARPIAGGLSPPSLQDMRRHL